ncbi:MAG TPA: TonB-dependent receptor [Luteitalea sp.]|nr:TonB-dependent receptor [Luteitalea sp.]
MAVVCAMPCSGRAQAARTLAVRVTDSSGAAVSGAVVVREGAGGTDTLATDARGEASFKEVPRGAQRLMIIQPGFATAVREIAEDAEPGAIDVVLSPQALSETLMVVGEAPTYRATTAATGSKIAVPVLENPQSVSVVTRQSLEDRQVLRLAETAQAVAGVIPAPGYGGLPTGDFTIRGFRPGFSGGNNLRNGYRDFNFLTPRDMQGIERVEFLKGPASLLYGLTEVGGVTNTISKRPLPAFSGEVGVQVGSFGLLRPTADVTGPVGDSKTLFYRVNFASDHNSSYRDFHDNDSTYVNGSLAWRPSARTSIHVEVEAQRYSFVHDGGFGTSAEFVTLPLGRFLGEPDWNDGLNRQGSGTVEVSHAFSDRWSYRGAFNTIASESDLRFMSYRGLQGRLLNRVGIDSVERTNNYSVQNEVYGRFSTGRIEHTLVTGLDLAAWRFFYVWDQAAFAPIDIYEPVYGARPGTLTPSFGEDARTRYAGAYVVDQMKFGDRFAVHAGMRGDWSRITTQDARTRVDTSDLDNGSVVPRGAFVFTPDRETSLYVSYAASFLPQAGVSRLGDRFDPMRGRQVELGAKRSLAGGRALATAAWFQIWKENVSTGDPVDPQFRVQTGEQTSRGLELELAGNVAPGVSLNASYAYTDAFVSRDTSTPVGTPLVNVPTHAGGLLGNYRIGRGPLAGLSLGASVYALGRRRVALFSPFQLEEYTRVDAFATYRLARWRLQVNVKNLGDVRYFDSTSFNIHPQSPRQVVVALYRQF